MVRCAIAFGTSGISYIFLSLLTFSMYTLVDGIRIFGNSLFIREYYNTIFFQYKIIENESH